MRYRIILALLLVVACTAGCTYSVVEGLYILAAALLAGVVASCSWLISEVRQNIKKITIMLNALENNDSTFRFHSGGDGYNELFISTLNRINEIFAHEKMSMREQERFFEVMLDNVITGIITINDHGQVIHYNDKALGLLGLSVFTHVTQLKRLDPAIYELFTSPESEGGHILSFFNERGEVHLSVKFSQIKVRGENLKIVAINDIGEELEEKEIESWTRLIRVLTHEIMNTITPVASLSDTLLMMIRKEEGKSAEIAQGLEVISNSSKGLISFVNSYRSLTRIPTPNKQPVYIKDLIHRVVTLEKESLSEASVTTQINLKDETIMVYIDENLISQVLINLIKNSVAAISEGGTENPFIRFDVSINPETEDVILEVSNNGKAIDKENQDHIFVPFFTTKSSGTGVGLSVSRQIMRQHGGTLKLKSSTPAETTFTMVFR